ncbi:MAG: cupin domain-containing protein [Ruminococcaceae bacterium]|nr:cupin domain-containing protein [Oscillospiraceae bacterium]
MENKLREIAERIKALREIMGYSESYMAERTGVTEEEYKTIESGSSDFSFTFIHKCAQTFGVDATDILKGSSPTLSSFSVTKAGEGLPIVRRKGFNYNNLAPLFKNKVAEPFVVTSVYHPEQKDMPIKLGTHEGQEFDYILEGKLKVQIDDHVEVLEPGDSVYYNSGTPHGMVAWEGDCKFIAVVIDAAGNAYDYSAPTMEKQPADSEALSTGAVWENFITTTLDENGVLNSIKFKNEDKFNFGFDCVDAIANKNPGKLAMLHLSADKTERRFTFGDMKRLSAKAANYFESLGIKKGDRVLVVLKRHWQFWVTITALHKMGAIIIPATNLLVEHDFEYRFNAAGVSAVICTADGDVAHQADLGATHCDTLKTKILCCPGEKRQMEGWVDFDGMESCSDVYERREDTACGDDPILMFFTSGTTGYPKIATHSCKYALGHFITAKYWHNVDPDGIHFTISDTGWGKALWGKYYGQWLCEAAVFTYDFNKFDANDILPLFAKYNITTFCAPPTMYRFFIKEDLSRFDLSSLKYSNTAGEALNPEVWQQWFKATGLSLMEGFGQTETTLALANLVGMTPKPGSMGKPSPLYDVQILNADGTKCAVGETGEICIRTAEHVPCGIFLGYYNNEEKTKEAWHDGYYHTGDTAWMDEDGYYWYVGRTDDLIKSSGYRIGPFEIESVIMELPYVLECAVTGVPDPIRGQVVKATIVLVKNKEGNDELKKEIQNYVKTHTAPYKYPRVVEFVTELPKTISGKIRRVEIRANDGDKK